MLLPASFHQNCQAVLDALSINGLRKKIEEILFQCRNFSDTREIHPLDPQPHRYCMLASTASAPRVTRCSLGLYWSRDLCTAGWLAGWGMLSYLGQIVRGSEIWWFMTSAHSLSTSLRWYIVWISKAVWFRWYLPRSCAGRNGLDYYNISNGIIIIHINEDG